MLKKTKGDIYFSIEKDGIHPSSAPGVGTPEPYGLRDLDLRDLIEKLSTLIFCFVIMEKTPLYDNVNMTPLAAKMIQNFIGSKEKK